MFSMFVRSPAAAFSAVYRPLRNSQDDTPSNKREGNTLIKCPQAVRLILCWFSPLFVDSVPYDCMIGFILKATAGSLIATHHVSLSRATRVQTSSHLFLDRISLHDTAKPKGSN